MTLCCAGAGIGGRLGAAGGVSWLEYGCFGGFTGSWSG